MAEGALGGTVVCGAAVAEQSSCNELITKQQGCGVGLIGVTAYWHHTT
jgi:hypothetical protein